MEYKAIPAEFKASGDQGQYAGHFAVFNNIDDGGDVIRPGAFTKSLLERAPRIKPYFMHDPTKLLGPAPTRIEEDSKGLYVEGRLTLGNSWAKDAWELMKDNALTEGSIGYQAIPDKTDWKEGVRVLGEIKLFEYSFVSLGMNPLTSVSAVKALRLDPDAREESLVTLAGEALAELKAGRMISRSNMEKLRAALSALDEIIKAAEPESEKDDHSDEEPGDAEKSHHSRQLRKIREAEIKRQFAEMGVYLP